MKEGKEEKKRKKKWRDNDGKNITLRHLLPKKSYHHTPLKAIDSKKAMAEKKEKRENSFLEKERLRDRSVPKTVNGLNFQRLLVPLRSRSIEGDESHPAGPSRPKVIEIVTTDEDNKDFKDHEDDLSAEGEGILNDNRPSRLKPGAAPTPAKRSSVAPQSDSESDRSVEVTGTVRRDQLGRQAENRGNESDTSDGTTDGEDTKRRRASATSTRLPPRGQSRPPPSPPPSSVPEGEPEGLSSTQEGDKEDNGDTTDAGEDDYHPNSRQTTVVQQGNATKSTPKPHSQRVPTLQALSPDSILPFEDSPLPPTRRGANEICDSDTGDETVGPWPSPKKISIHAIPIIPLPVLTQSPPTSQQAPINPSPSSSQPSPPFNLRKRMSSDLSQDDDNRFHSFGTPHKRRKTGPVLTKSPANETGSASASQESIVNVAETPIRSSQDYPRFMGPTLPSLESEILAAETPRHPPIPSREVSGLKSKVVQLETLDDNFTLQAFSFPQPPGYNSEDSDSRAGSETSEEAELEGSPWDMDETTDDS